MSNVLTYTYRTHAFRVGLGLGLGVNELERIDCCNDGEKHCLPTRVGEREPTEVITCKGSVNDRGRFMSVIMASGSGSSYYNTEKHATAQCEITVCMKLTNDEDLNTTHCKTANSIKKRRLKNTLHLFRHTHCKCILKQDVPLHLIAC
jgi:hypothetical protein